jgi:ABC-type amino acid transport substrate-binding protein
MLAKPGKELSVYRARAYTISMMAKLIPFIVLAMLWGMIKYAFASAGAEPCNRRFDVGLANYAPVAYRENGKMKGIGHEITRELAKRTGCVFSENEYPRPSAISQMKQGRLDLFLLTGSVLEFENFGGFVPLYETERSLTILESANGKHHTIADVMKDKTIKFGVMIGSQTSLTKEEYRQLIDEDRTIGAPGPDGLFQMLKSGRVQAIMFTSATTKYYLKKYNLWKLVRRFPDPKVVTTVGYVYSKRRMSERDIDLIAKTMSSLKADGTLSRIFTSHYDPGEAELRLK